LAEQKSALREDPGARAISRLQTIHAWRKAEIRAINTGRTGSWLRVCNVAPAGPAAADRFANACNLAAPVLRAEKIPLLSIGLRN